jgi:hypothetical protein
MHHIKERSYVFMSLLLWLIVIATVLNGMLAGGSLDGSLVKLPARRRIGVVAYATFARGNDLGNGLVVYPVWAVSAALLTFIARLPVVATGPCSHLGAKPCCGPNSLT